MKEYVDYLLNGDSDGLFKLEGETMEEFAERCYEREYTLFGDVIDKVRESEEYKADIEHLEKISNELRKQNSSDTSE